MESMELLLFILHCIHAALNSIVDLPAGPYIAIQIIIKVESNASKCTLGDTASAFSVLAY